MFAKVPRSLDGEEKEKLRAGAHAARQKTRPDCATVEAKSLRSKLSPTKLGDCVGSGSATEVGCRLPWFVQGHVKIDELLSFFFFFSGCSKDIQLMREPLRSRLTSQLKS